LQGSLWYCVPASNKCQYHNAVMLKYSWHYKHCQFFTHFLLFIKCLLMLKYMFRSEIIINSLTEIVPKLLRTFEVNSSFYIHTFGRLCS
jgi:hypothetical protein